jgi:VID27 C-terminal WD40-like domain
LQRDIGERLKLLSECEQCYIYVSPRNSRINSQFSQSVIHHATIVICNSICHAILNTSLIRHCFPSLCEMPRRSFSPTLTDELYSIGPYVVKWDFAKVLRNDPKLYKITEYPYPVVSHDFPLGVDNKIVVALTKTITMAGRERFRQPTATVFRDC